MSLSPVYQIAANGIRNSLADFHKNAAVIASAATLESSAPSDLVGPMLNINADSLQIEALVKLLKSADETLGALLDVQA